jgi:hypothetical protein
LFAVKKNLLEKIIYATFENFRNVGDIDSCLWN